ncbi:unnamed protein product [Rhodiola kirilowii]
MAGIINKIGDALHIGGDKKAEEHHKAEEHKKVEEHKGEHKEGVLEKIKDKIHGEKSGDGEHKEGEKKKKDKKKKKDGEKKHHGGDSSSSSDSD